jgi:hypothetical protein
MLKKIYLTFTISLWPQCPLWWKSQPHTKKIFENNLHTYILYVYWLTIRMLRSVCWSFEHTLTYIPAKQHGRVTAKTGVSVWKTGQYMKERERYTKCILAEYKLYSGRIQMWGGCCCRQASGLSEQRIGRCRLPTVRWRMYVRCMFEEQHTLYKSLTTRALTAIM